MSDKKVKNAEILQALALTVARMSEKIDRLGAVHKPLQWLRPESGGAIRLDKVISISPWKEVGPGTHGRFWLELDSGETAVEMTETRDNYNGILQALTGIALPGEAPIPVMGAPVTPSEDATELEPQKPAPPPEQPVGLQPAANRGPQSTRRG